MLIFNSRSFCIAVVLATFSHLVSATEISKSESKNMRLVGYHDLQGRTAYQPTIQKQGDRWIAYVGHHGDYRLNALNGKMEKK